MRAAASFVLLAFAYRPIPFAHPIQQPKGNAVIVGVVVDEHDAPVARAQVQAFSAEEVQKALRNSQRLGRSTASASTDATGAFRISDLPAGDYVMAAEPMPTFPNGGPLPARVYGTTFYPSTLDVSQAAFVNAVDRPAAKVQIKLLTVIPVRVKGTVTGASGRSTEGFDVGLFRSFGGFGSGATVAVVGANGIFEIPRVPPGAYRLTIQPHASRPGQEGRVFVDTMIDVKDHDLDLALTAGPGASLRGRVVAEPAGAVTTPIGIRVTASQAREQLAAGTAIAAAVNSDWSLLRRAKPRRRVSTAPRARLHSSTSSRAKRSFGSRWQSDRPSWRCTMRAYCRRLPIGLVTRIVTSAATSRSSSAASAIPADYKRSPVSLATGRSDRWLKESRPRLATADIGSSARLPQTVITRRICSAICAMRVALRCSCRSSTILRRNRSCRGPSDKSETRAQFRLSSPRSTTTIHHTACW